MAEQSAKPCVLSIEIDQEWDQVPMRESFEVHELEPGGDPAQIDPATRERIQAIAFKGHSMLGPEIVGAFPNVGLIANFGVGYDTIDVDYASSRGIKVTNTPDVLTNDVADLGIGMLLALNRDIVGASEWVRAGKWSSHGNYPLQRSITGVSIGIAGLGRIGRAIGQRLEAFEAVIHYYSRTDKQCAGWNYHNDLVELARTVDILFVTVSGGPDTRQIISKEVIEALGSDGLLVNCARGSTVDEEALINALQSGQLRGCATDVFNNEPDIDPRFMELDNVLLQPHQSSATVETRQAMGKLQRDNLHAFFEGRPLLTPVN